MTDAPTEGVPTTVIPVSGAAPYDVLVGRGLVAELPAVLGPKVKKVLIVHAPPLGAKAEQLRTAAEARFAVQQTTALTTFADRLANREPIILRSTDTVRTYAQTAAGRAACLPADRVRGIDALDAELFAGDPPSAGRGEEALHGDADAPHGRQRCRQQCQAQRERVHGIGQFQAGAHTHQRASQEQQAESAAGQHRQGMPAAQQQEQR